MEDEIKEIIDRLRKCDYDDFNKLLDYITNLQERKITKEDVDKYFEENMCVSFDKFIENWDEQEKWVNYYKKENERLKEIAEEHKNCTRKHWQQKCAEHCANEMIYKSRCEKAKKYIKENEFYLDYKTGACIKGVIPLLNILEGEDKDE